jgi:hypothetical protein
LYTSLVIFLEFNGKSPGPNCIAKDQVSCLQHSYRSYNLHLTSIPITTKLIATALTAVGTGTLGSSRSPLHQAEHLPHPPAVPSLLSPAAASGVPAKKSMSKSPADLNGTGILQHRSIGMSLYHTRLILDQATPCKHMLFLNFHRLQQNAAVIIFTIPNFLLHNQHLAIDSKSAPISRPNDLEIRPHTFLATTHPKTSDVQIRHETSSSLVIFDHIHTLSRAPGPRVAGPRLRSS